MVCSIQESRQQAVVAKNISEPTLWTGATTPDIRKAYVQISIRKLSPLGTGSDNVVALRRRRGGRGTDGPYQAFWTADSAPSSGTVE